MAGAAGGDGIRAKQMTIKLTGSEWRGEGSGLRGRPVAVWRCGGVAGVRTTPAENIR
jgi:hypothetical protein